MENELLNKRPFMDLMNVVLIILMWSGLSGVITYCVDEHYEEQKREMYVAMFLIASFVLYTKRDFLFY